MLNLGLIKLSDGSGRVVKARQQIGPDIAGFRGIPAQRVKNVLDMGFVQPAETGLDNAKLVETNIFHHPLSASLPIHPIDRGTDRWMGIAPFSMICVSIITLRFSEVCTSVFPKCRLRRSEERRVGKEC